MAQISSHAFQEWLNPLAWHTGMQKITLDTESLQSIGLLPL
jgi:hypothetical protein